MNYSLPNFFADATLQAATELEQAYLRLPEDKRHWSPPGQQGQEGQARTAADMVAECALMNAQTVRLLDARVFPAAYFGGEYQSAKATLSQREALLSQLRDNTANATERIRTISSDDLNHEVAMPWGQMTLAQVIAYPYWNMTYHTGQINYIASLLGCLP
jgi:hypothetical protein